MKQQSEIVNLANISTQKWPPRQRTYLGAVSIASPEEGQEYALTEIHSCKGKMDLGDKHMMEFAISAREIAEDLAREINGDSGEGSFHGVFVCAGAKPTKEELADAKGKLQAFHQRLVETADLEWERSHNPMFITDLERRAARELKLDKPWLYDPKPQAECPACGEKVRPGVAVCRSCHAILDREKAAKFGFVAEEKEAGEYVLRSVRPENNRKA